jgi:hypothetical protein
MNERINQFYEQCNQVVDDPFGGAHISFDHRMFAQLIVRECMTIGFNTVYKVDDDRNAVAVYQNIKEHFGVEE